MPFQPPADHPKVALPATRAFYFLETTRPGVETAFARETFRRYYSGRLDTSDAEAVAALAGELGLDVTLVRAGMEAPVIKDRARALSEAAVARGIFGSPFFVVDGEPFWGWDRIPMVEEWLRTGGW
ncbi:MAG TPA: DsbA family protein [Myxococcota bacterium]|nr:DsbA family protein [Myxococcota bacterium]